MSDLAALFDELVRCETELWNVVDAELRARHGLPLGRYEPMRVIAATPGCRVYDVATALSLSTGGASKLVDALERSGYVARAPNPSDRRSSLVTLTPAGRRMTTRAGATFERTLERCLGELPPQMLDRLTGSLRRVRAGLAPPPPRA